MIRNAIAVFAGLMMLATSACSGADPGPQGGGGQQSTDPQLGWPSGDNDSTMDDGSYWPRWKNPCPGPACDPYRNDPRWLVDPPPDTVVQPATQPGDPGGHLAPQAKTGTAER